jgi:hypothetical protein
VAKSAAHSRNGSDSLGTGSEAVVSRHRPHPQTRPSTAIVVEQRPLIRDLLSRSLKQKAGESGDATDASLVLISIAGNSNAEETRQTLRRAAQALPNTPIVVLSDGEDFERPAVRNKRLHLNRDDARRGDRSALAGASRPSVSSCHLHHRQGTLGSRPFRRAASAARLRYFYSTASDGGEGAVSR